MSQSESTTVGVDKPVILLDMDGVIANFVQAMIDSHKLDISHDDWTDWNYHRTIGLTDEQFWEPTHRDNWWYVEVGAYVWTMELLRELPNVGHVVFCSTPNKAKDCAADKAKWLKYYCTFYDPAITNHQEIVFTQHKHLLAKPNAVLIDDKDENVDNFHKAGGAAVLFPQPWNSHRAYVEEFRKDVVGNVVMFAQEALAKVRVYK